MYSATIDIAATPAHVFSVLTSSDLTLWKQWQPEAIEVQHPDGGLRVGAAFRVLVKEFGRRFHVQFVVVALDPDARLVYDMSSPLMRGRIEWFLTPRPRSTNVSWLVVPAPPKNMPLPIARIMGALMRPLLTRKLRRRLEALRRAVEADGRQP